MSAGIHLRLGPVVLAVTSTEAVLAQYLRTRYGPYDVGEPPTHHLSVTSDHPYDPVTAPNVTWTDEGPHWLGRSGALLASFDSSHARGTAAVTVDPDGIGSAIDNALRGIAVRLLAQHSLLLIHGSGVVRGDRLTVFYGPSGVGKTTLTRLASAAGFPVAGDDLLVVDPATGHGGGSPFWGDGADLPPAIGWWPIDGLWELHQSPASRRERLAGAAAAAALLCQVPLPARYMPQLLDGVSQLVANVPHGRLYLARPTGWPDIEEIIA